MSKTQRSAVISVLQFIDSLHRCSPTMYFRILEVMDLDDDAWHEELRVLKKAVGWETNG